MARTNTNTGGGGGAVNSVTASLPLTSSGGANPNIAINAPGANQVWFSDALGVLTGESAFTYNQVNDTYSFASAISPTHGVFYNGIGAPGALGNHIGLGIDMRPASLGITVGWVGIGSGTYTFWDDAGTQIIHTVSSATGFHGVRDQNGDQYFIVDPGNGNYFLGAPATVGNETSIYINDSSEDITVKLDQVFQINNTAGTAISFVADIANGLYGMGDTTQIANGNRFFIFDALNIMDFQCQGVARFGDIDNLNNNTKLTVDDPANRTFVVNSTLGLFGYTVATLPAGVVGDTAYVTDALAPAYGATAVGGGAIVLPVFYNGVAWITA